MVEILVGCVVLVGLATASGGVYLYRENRDLRRKLLRVETEISATVEERLVSHAKYCEQVDALVKAQLAEESVKWRELLVGETHRIKGALTTARKDAQDQVQRDWAEIEALLEKQKMNFKGLLEEAYLEQYEKMRRSPPRPKKGPRKKIDPPQRFRSLDDDFSFCPPSEPTTEE